MTIKFRIPHGQVVSVPGAFPTPGNDQNYVTDAEKAKLANLSGTNTGDQNIPDQLSDLSDDTTHRLVTDTEKSTWNGKQNALGFTPENSANKGVSGGYAELDGTGKVPSAQLPAFVDDVIEAANYSDLVLLSGESGKIYTTINDGKMYRWSGSVYTEVSASLALGENSGTAYRGDRGKLAYEHSQTTPGNPHGTSCSDIGAATSENPVFTGFIQEQVSALDGWTLTASGGTVRTKVLDSSGAFIDGLSSGQSMSLLLTLAGYAPSWPDGMRWENGPAPSHAKSLIRFAKINSLLIGCYGGDLS